MDHLVVAMQEALQPGPVKAAQENGTSIRRQVALPLLPAGRSDLTQVQAEIRSPVGELEML